MRTIRSVRHHHPKDERALYRFWCRIVVSPLKPMMVHLFSVSPVESVCERHLVFGWQADRQLSGITSRNAAIPLPRH
jgi:hypothetical protein